MSSDDSASWAKFRSELATRASAPPRPAGLPRGSPPRLPRAIKGSPARQSVAQLLFPDPETTQRTLGLTTGEGAPPRQRHGRAPAILLAERLASIAAEANEAAGAADAHSLVEECDVDGLTASRAAALLALPEGALLADGVDACWRAPHCAEHALIVEFLRRHHAVVAESSRALLRLLQTALRENAALASRTDESLLGTFQAYVDAALAEALRNAPAGAAPAARAVAASAAVSEAAFPFR